MINSQPDSGRKHKRPVLPAAFFRRVRTTPYGPAGGASEIVDPRAAQIEWLKTQVAELQGRVTKRAFCPGEVVWFEVQVSRQLGVDSRVSLRP
ncbi:hypothetical protein ACFYX7_52985, partial [Streptomyces mirabilis]